MADGPACTACQYALIAFLAMQVGVNRRTLDALVRLV